jgi:endonuclease/exonuclease/phosphatase (EEP) superfamily protein YafD
MRILSDRRLSVALAVSAAVTIFATLAALGGEWWWGFELLTHFRMQYLGVQALLFALLLLQRRFRWCFALGSCAVLNGLPLVPYLPLGAAIASEAEATVTLMTVNVEAGNRHHERLLDIVAEEAPDVLLVVEFTHAWQEKLRPLFRMYPHRVLLPEPSAWGIALLSRYPLGPFEAFDLESTSAVDAHVQSPFGTFRLIGVHLKSPTSRAAANERNRQLRALAELRQSASEPLAIVGDFNITPYSPIFADWLIETGLRDARSGTGVGISWPTFLPILGIPIDHCVVSPELKVADFKRLPRFGSDHYPVLVELTLEQTS